MSMPEPHGVDPWVGQPSAKLTGTWSPISESATAQQLQSIFLAPYLLPYTAPETV